MKKILSLILALTLVMSLSVTAFAEIYEQHEQQVVGRYKKLDEAIVIRANVEWHGMHFVYHDGTARLWEPGLHEYKGQVTGRKFWTCAEPNQDLIKVTNHSNTDVDVIFAFESTVEGITGKFKKIVNNFELDHTVLGEATEGQVDTADYVTVRLELAGPLQPVGNVINDIQLGTVKITIKKSELVDSEIIG